MKRDMELIKLLLAAVEKSAASACVIPEPSDFPEPIRPTEADPEPGLAMIGSRLRGRKRVCVSQRADAGNRPPVLPDLGEHCRLLVERGLVRGEPTFSGWVLTGLTWDGHDFLDNSRESKVWQAAKKAAGNLSFGVFIKVLVETATRYAMSKIETV